MIIQKKLLEEKKCLCIISFCMAIEKPSFEDTRKERLHSLIQIQEQSALSVFNFLDGFIGDTYLLGRKVRISSGPRDFLLKIDNDDRSQIVFNAGQFDSDPDSTRVKSKYTLFYSGVDEKTGRSTTTYRFNEGSTYRRYQNGQSETRVSEMTDEDFTKVYEIFEAINRYLRPN